MSKKEGPNEGRNLPGSEPSGNGKKKVYKVGGDGKGLMPYDAASLSKMMGYNWPYLSPRQAEEGFWRDLGFKEGLEKPLKFHSFHYLVNDDEEPPEPIIDGGVLLPQTLLLIYGPPKEGKTFLTLNMARSLATGERFVGFEVPKPRKVMILSAEGGYFPLRERVKVLCEGLEEEALRRVHIATNASLQFDKRGGRVQLNGVLDAYRPEVLIIDPLVRFHGGNENSARDMAQVYNYLRLVIEEHDLSVVLVHHTGKDTSKGARGSSVITSEYDASIELEKKKGGHELTFDMRHVETPPKRSVYFDPDTYRFSLSGSEAVRVLMESGPLERKELVERIEEKKGVSDSTAYRWVKKDEKRGVIIENEDGLLTVAEGVVFHDESEEDDS